MCKALRKEITFMAKVKSKVKPLEQTDGRNDRTKARSIDEILGNAKSRYRQQTVEEYQAYLEQLNLSDIQKHAQSVGLIPVADRKTLVGRLIKEFRKTSSPYYGTAVTEAPKVKLSDRAQKILATGR